LSASCQLCADIQRLGIHHNQALHNSVIRRLDRLLAARDALPFVGDRIPQPETFTDGVPIAFIDTPSGEPTLVRIPLDRLTTHAFFCGVPGSGKTHAVRILLTQLPPHVRVIIFDPNRSYEVLCSDPTRWLSIDWEDTRLNPLLPPPGYVERKWLNEAAEILTRGELLHSRWLYVDELDRAFESAHARARAPGGAFVCPSLFDVYDALARRRFRYGSREQGYLEALRNVLHGRLRSTGDVYNCSSGMEPALINTRVRISTEGLMPLPVTRFFIDCIIHYACRARSLAPLPDPPRLHTLIVIEEAQTLLAKLPGITFYEELLLRARALGVGFVLLAQDIANIDPIILAAVSNIFLFAQSSSEGKRVAQSMLDLSKGEAELLGRLSTGRCYIRYIGHKTFPYAFTARTPSHV
ncbi:MAG: hypothetical protein KJ052_19485, partial [Candidatus Hydrogenedentes bacterium]|nr:hypothetical protein [Candidatus Hydrogenedentota bacterium]